MSIKRILLVLPGSLILAGAVQHVGAAFLHLCAPGSWPYQVPPQLKCFFLQSCSLLFGPSLSYCSPSQRTSLCWTNEVQLISSAHPTFRSHAFQHITAAHWLVSFADFIRGVQPIIHLIKEGFKSYWSYCQSPRLWIAAAPCVDITFWTWQFSTHLIALRPSVSHWLRPKKSTGYHVKGLSESPAALIFSTHLYQWGKQSGSLARICPSVSLWLGCSLLPLCLCHR